MKSKLTFSILLVIAGLNVFSQENLPTIKANSLRADILDGTLKKNVWRITPEAKPDIYFTNNLASPIVFYTDIDSISFQLKADKACSFIILVNGKDSAYTQIKYKKSNLDVLKDAWEYSSNDKRALNSYTYPKPNSADLLLIRNRFNLDSIAGKGSEISKITNLLSWVNHTFKYDGTKDAPSYRSVSDLMIKCKNGEGTLNCGAMAWVMRDCYLSMGFKAKQVVCFPKDSTDFECHSTIAVFSEDNKKWLFIDPSNCTYAMNDKGEIMSFAELREALIGGKIIRLSKGLSNNGRSLSSDSYLNYIAKNFYAFQCFSDNDGESISNLLLPVEYKGDFSHTVQNHPKVTNDPKEFWKNPEQ